MQYVKRVLKSSKCHILWNSLQYNFLFRNLVDSSDNSGFSSHKNQTDPFHSVQDIMMCKCSWTYCGLHRRSTCIHFFASLFYRWTRNFFANISTMKFIKMSVSMTTARSIIFFAISGQWHQKSNCVFAKLLSNLKKFNFSLFIEE